MAAVGAASGAASAEGRDFPLPPLDVERALHPGRARAAVEASIPALLAALGLVAERVTHHGDSDGVINDIWFLSHVSGGGGGGEGRDLVLRVSNPHPYWHTRKTASEVAVMRYLAAVAPSLPLPVVVAASCDAGAPHLADGDADYILMTRLPGVPLSACLHALSPAAVTTALRDLLHCVATLHAVPLPPSFATPLLASFALPPPREGGAPDAAPGGIIADAPPLGPFPSLRAFAAAHLAWAVDQFDASGTGAAPGAAFLARHAARLRPLVAAAAVAVAAAPPPAWLDLTTEGEARVVICHMDLNPSNLLVDATTGAITGVLDWEKARAWLPEGDRPVLDGWDVECEDAAASSSSSGSSRGGSKHGSDDDDDDEDAGTLSSSVAARVAAVVALREEETAAGLSDVPGAAARAPIIDGVMALWNLAVRVPSWYVDTPAARDHDADALAATLEAQADEYADAADTALRTLLAALEAPT